MHQMKCWSWRFGGRGGRWGSSVAWMYELLTCASRDSSMTECVLQSTLFLNHLKQE